MGKNNLISRKCRTNAATKEDKQMSKIRAGKQFYELPEKAGILPDEHKYSDISQKFHK